MEPIEYQRLANYERWYWWYRAERSTVDAAVRALRLPAGARVLDAGCGTGTLLARLARRLRLDGYGVDASPHAAATWNGEAAVRRCRGSVNALPYADHAFDAALCVDVLQCAGVGPEQAVGELARVVRPGGTVILLAPAFQWLRSSHDAAVHSVHRFHRSELRAIAEAARLRVMRCTFLFPLFFPAIAAARLMRKRRVARLCGRPRSDLAPLPKWLNETLWLVARAEQLLTRTVGAPIGSTILVVGRKEDR